MPKCEQCFDEKGEPNFEPLEGPVGYCKVHKCMRKVNDSCNPEEIQRGDDWGASEAVMSVDAGR
jgi:hypothetical protein